MALLSPKTNAPARIPQHGAYQSPVLNFRALLFLVGLVIVALISILGIGRPYDEEQASSRASCGGRHKGPGTSSPYHERRNEVYDKMDSDFGERGAEFLFDGATSQSLKVSDIFALSNGKVKPVFKAALPPVRAQVLHLDPEVAKDIAQIVKDHLVHHFPAGVWFQDPNVYHMSMFHASHHLSPVPISAKRMKDEIKAVRGVAAKACPLRVSLDRVLLTTSGVLVGCWQVLEGTDPSEIRDELRDALPHGPAKQLYDRVMLHTSLARILAPPIWPDGTRAHNAEAAIPILTSIVYELNKKLCRTEATVKEMWYVEELDVLALALGGRMDTHRFNLSCLQPDWTGTV